MGLSADSSEGWSVGLSADSSEGWSVGLSAVSLSSANDGPTGLVEGWSLGLSADWSDVLVVPYFAIF
jgi:hypothetical protein